MNVLSEAVVTHMTQEPQRIAPDDSLDRVESVMRDSCSRHWPVVRDRTLVGLVALRDLIKARGSGADASLDPSELTTAQVMTPAHTVARPGDHLRRAVLLMYRFGLSCLPVVERDRLVGVVTIEHLVEVAIDRLDEGRAPRVSLLMTRAPVATAHALDDVEYAATLMREFDVRHLPVVDHGAVVGVLSEGDVLRALVSPEDPLEILVEEIMTRPARCTAPDASAARAGELIVGERVGALPVLFDSTLVGILSKTDFLRYLTTLKAEKA